MWWPSGSRQKMKQLKKSYMCCLCRPGATAVQLAQAYIVTTKPKFVAKKPRLSVGGLVSGADASLGGGDDVPRGAADSAAGSVVPSDDDGNNDDDDEDADDD